VPRAGLDHDRVVAAAAAIADAEGLDAVKLARVAAALGVKSPSLYDHVDGRDGLVRGIALLGLAELAADIHAAVHGFATLETSGGFGLDLDVDASFDRLVGMLADGLG
jgi:AcrR family transcriptional regulator